MMAELLHHRSRPTGQVKERAVLGGEDEGVHGARVLRQEARTKTRAAPLSPTVASLAVSVVCPITRRPARSGTPARFEPG